MPLEFSMRYSPELLDGVVEQIREEFRQYDLEYTERSQASSIEFARLLIELELAKRSGMKDYVAEAEANFKAHEDQRSAEMIAHMRRTIKEEVLNELVSTENWFNTILYEYIMGKAGDRENSNGQAT